MQLKGVTFNNELTGENRQELLQQASSGEPVLCCTEPDNPVDSRAVRVVGPRVRSRSPLHSRDVFLEHDILCAWSLD